MAERYLSPMQVSDEEDEEDEDEDEDYEEEAPKKKVLHDGIVQGLASSDVFGA